MPDLREKPVGEGKVKSFLLRTPLVHFIEQVRILMRKAKLSRCEDRNELSDLVHSLIFV